MKIVGILLLLSFINVGICLSNSLNDINVLKRDSLINSIQNSKDYKTQTKDITDLLNSNYLKNPNFVINYIEENILNNPKYISDTVFYANTINTYSTSFYYIDLKKCAEYAKMGLDYIGDNQNPRVLEKVAMLSSNLANATGAMGYPMTRLKMLIDLAPTILKVENPFLQRNYHFRLGGIYYEYNELDKSIENLKKGIFIQEDFRYHPNFAGVAELLIASTYVKLNNQDSLKKYVNLTNSKKKLEFNILHQARLKNLLGLVAAYDNNFEKALKLLNEGSQIAKSTSSSTEIMYSNFLLAKSYAINSNHVKAIEIYKDLLKNSSQSELDNYRSFVLKGLSKSYVANKQYDSAYATNQALIEFLEYEKNKNQNLYIEELNYSYKFNEYLNELEKLKFSNEKAEVTKDRDNLFIITLLISLTLLIVILFFVMKAHRRNKTIAMQEYDLLKANLEEEKSNRLISEIKLLKQIEDKERNRIATDLHDSIGGLLSSIKIALFNYQENISLTNKQKQDTDRVLEYVDETKQELNRIVYNLTPLLVEKFGLLEAIKQYCKKIQNESLQINLQIISVPAKIAVDDEITLYRIIQEILHNIVKHAHADNVLLQIQTDYPSGMVIISIEDDGQGMNVNAAMNKGGLGMKSLYSRVQNLRGSIAIESQKDAGTAVYINCFPKSIQEKELTS